jgi:hypothetical protein
VDVVVDVVVDVDVSLDVDGDGDGDVADLGPQGTSALPWRIERGPCPLASPR